MAATIDTAVVGVSLANALANGFDSNISASRAANSSAAAVTLAAAARSLSLILYGTTMGTTGLPNIGAPPSDDIAAAVAAAIAAALAAI